MSRSVAITGMGVISSAGNDLDSFVSRVLAGVACFGRINDARAPQYGGRRAALVGEEALEEALRREGVALPLVWQGRPVDRVVALALPAAREALRRSGIDPRALGARCGLIFATCSGPMLSIERHYARIVEGDPHIDAQDLFAKRYYAPAMMLADMLGVAGCCTTVVTACSASAAALGVAADLIRAGMLDAALAGGADAFALSTFAGFDGLKAVSPDTCAPFSLPMGLTLGEGAGFLVLEDAARAHRRNGDVAAYLLGYGLSNDAYHPTAPDPCGKGQALAMTAALAHAGLTPEAITYINAHGTGTEANDKAEVRAIRRALGASADGVLVSSTKSMVGHCLGAAAAIEAIASIAGARQGVYPPTAGFSLPREGCAIDAVADAGRAWRRAGPFMSNSFAFGGNNASVIFAAGNYKALEPRPAAGAEVFISGIGLISAAGLGAAALARSLDKKEDCRTHTDLSGWGPIAVAQAPVVDPRSVDRRFDVRGMDRSSVLALVAVHQAIVDARCGGRQAGLARMGFYLHLSAGPSRGESDYLTALCAQRFHIDKVLAFPYVVPNSVSGNVCRALMMTGHNATFCAGPDAGLSGLAPAVAALREGHAGGLVSASVDELSARILLDGMHAGVYEGGVVPGEGAAALVLETEAHLRSRGHPALARICSIIIDGSEATSGWRDTIACAVDQAGIGIAAIGAFVCETARGAAEILDAMDSGWRQRSCSVSAAVGHAEASQPLFGVAVALERLRARGPAKQPCILVLGGNGRAARYAAVVEALPAPG